MVRVHVDVATDRLPDSLRTHGKLSRKHLPIQFFSRIQTHVCLTLIFISIRWCFDSNNPAAPLLPIGEEEEKRRRRKTVVNLMRISVWSISNVRKQHVWICSLSMNANIHLHDDESNGKWELFFFTVRIEIFYGNLFCLHFKCVVRNWIVGSSATTKTSRRRNENGVCSNKRQRNTTANENRKEKWHDVMACMW